MLIETRDDGNLNLETSGDSKNVFLLCEDVSKPP